MIELAPSACIVCGLPQPPDKAAGGTWFYLAGATPAGAMVCGPKCLPEALR